MSNVAATIGAESCRTTLQRHLPVESQDGLPESHAGWNLDRDRSKQVAGDGCQKKKLSRAKPTPSYPILAPPIHATQSTMRRRIRLSWLPVVTCRKDDTNKLRQEQTQRLCYCVLTHNGNISCGHTICITSSHWQVAIHHAVQSDGALFL